MKKRITILFFLGIFSSVIFPETRGYQKINKLKETVEGEKLYSQGKYDDALEMLKEAIKKGETRGEPQYYIGSIHESRHQYEESIPYFQEAIRHELQPEFREATLWKLIILLRKHQNFAEMIGYIDMLEDLGINHENLKKFREEAQENLSPEKIKARLLIKEAKKITSDWESENPERDFWSAEGNEKERITSLEKYTEAVSLDEDLFNMYWDIAGYYEKMSSFSKAVEIYEKIINKNKDPQAYFKTGVIYRKNGEYEKARDYLLNALKELKENSNIKYYLLVNLSQALYALADFENGIRYSLEAKENRRDNDIVYDTVVHCLHLSGKKEVSEIKKKCLSVIGKTELQKKDIRFTTLYHYMMGEVYGVLSETSSQDHESKVRISVENYSKALIPPGLRSAPLKGLKVKDSPENYEDVTWAALPMWGLVRLDHAVSYLKYAQADKELYQTLLVYKKYLKEKNQGIYFENLGSAAYRLGLFNESISAYKQISERNFEQETVLLKGYLQSALWNQFQDEVNAYLLNHPDSHAEMTGFLTSEVLVQNIPPDKRNAQLKKLMAIEDLKEKKIESGDIPEENPNPESTTPENGASQVK